MSALGGGAGAGDGLAESAAGAHDASFVLRVGWLAAMGAVFFSSYGFANWLAARRAVVPTFAFGWEHAIPFVPWTIVPYWSIDLLYALSFFFWTRRDDLLDHVKRLLTVQLVSVACFVAWPLRFGFERPDAGGVAGALFTLLMGFDKPFNQAPSLHIGLLVVLWAVYAKQLRGTLARFVLHPWFAAIGVSVLTTYQHHAIDVPTGAAVGCLALFLFPLRDAAGRLPGVTGSPSAGGRVLARRYALGAALVALVALGCVSRAPGWALAAGWVALALACVAWIYRRGAPGAFQKDDAGRFPVFIRWLLAPTIAGAFVNSRVWTFRHPAPARIDERVSIGRTPTTRDLRRHGFTALVDLTAEMPRWAAADASLAYASVPQLDLVAPTAAQLAAAVAALERLHAEGRDVLICCALGYGRSVLCAAAWLAARRGLGDARDALAAVRAMRPRAVWSDDGAAVLQDWIDRRRVTGAA
ncbi:MULTISPECIES: phosphatase PAP2/dual specificity phosphatase family protein [unclassified Burkholderia]|uniref:phosphatase PAP2/dual specificity phosphatase family protein n=1 Tax=unclassified Burkholderia TaxID=2613784 RepID=UPI0007595329|nr:MULTISPECIES: phosphatase PAP2/dual specificity phosphatase family protein [unclassified Burkholderia]KUY89606.1 serine/threonine protein phosphatase [Burkholderia sp. RF7-non_BP1]KUZ06255.1 serine/threonine protein phosphatase [Burkholderia sp. RF7-non_BP4]